MKIYKSVPKDEAIVVEVKTNESYEFYLIKAHYLGRADRLENRQLVTDAGSETFRNLDYCKNHLLELVGEEALARGVMRKDGTAPSKAAQFVTFTTKQLMEAGKYFDLFKMRKAQMPTTVNLNEVVQLTIDEASKLGLADVIANMPPRTYEFTAAELYDKKAYFNLMDARGLKKTEIDFTEVVTVTEDEARRFKLV